MFVHKPAFAFISPDKGPSLLHQRFLQMGYGMTTPDPLWHPQGLSMFDVGGIAQGDRDDIIDKVAIPFGNLLEAAAGYCQHDPCKVWIINVCTLFSYSPCCSLQILKFWKLHFLHWEQQQCIFYLMHRSKLSSYFARMLRRITVFIFADSCRQSLITLSLFTWGQESFPPRCVSRKWHAHWQIWATLQMAGLCTRHTLKIQHWWAAAGFITTSNSAIST